MNTNYTTTGTPAITNDLFLTGSTAYTALTDTSANLTIGSLDDNDTAAVILTIATGRSVTLGGTGNLGNSVSGTTTDLLYVATGSAITINGTGTGTLALSTASSGTPTLDIVGTATIGAIFTASNAFAKTGTGTLTLSGANAYTVGMTVTAGTVTAGVSSVAGPANAFTSGAFGVNSIVTIATGATLNLANFNEDIGALASGTTGGSVTLGSGTLTLGENNNAGSFGGVISGTGGLTKDGTNTQALYGVNTYSGTTTVVAGTLKLDFSQATSPTTNIISSSGALAMGGASAIGNITGDALTLAGSATASRANSQTFASTTFNVGSSAFNLNPGAATNTTLLNLGSLTRSQGSTVVFNQPNTNNTTVSATNGYTTTTANSDNILGGWATVGSDFATNNGTNIVALGTAGAAAYDGILPASGSTTGNYKLTTANVTTTASQTVNSLNLQGTGDLVVNTGYTLTLASGGLLSSVSNGNAAFVSGGSLTSTNGQNDLITTVNANNLFISSVIQDTTPGMGLTKSGGSPLFLFGANTYTGPTVIDGGTIYAGAASAYSGSTLVSGALGVNSTVTIANGTTLNLFNFNTQVGSLTGNGVLILGAGTITLGADNTSPFPFTGVISGSGGLTKIGTGTQTLSGSNTYIGATNINAGTLQINVGTAGGVNSGLGLNSAVTVASGATLSLFNSVANNNTQIGSLAGAGNVTLGSAILTMGGNNTNTTFTGVVSGTGQVIKIGTGTQTFGNLQTYAGNTTVSYGTLSLDFTLGTQPAANIIPAGKALSLGGGTLSLNGNANTANSETFASTAFTAGASSGVAIAGSGTGTNLLALGTYTRANGATVDFTLPAGTQSATNGITTTTATLDNGVLAATATGNAFATVAGTTWATLSGTNVIGLATANYSTPAAATSASNVDVTTSAALGTTANTLRFNTTTPATLTLSGTTVLTAGGILETAVVGSNASAISGGVLEGSSAGKDLVIIQNNTGGGLTVSSVIADNAAGTTLTKSGAGALTLSGANTYTGITYLNGGVTNVASEGATAGSAGSLGAVPAAVNATDVTFNGGTLQFASSFNLATFRGINILPGGATIDTQGFNTTYAGVIESTSGNGGLTKVGTGTLTLTGTDTYSGLTLINAGIINYQNATAFGNRGAITIASGATAQLQGSLGFGGTPFVTLSGTGASGATGALENVSGVNTESSPLLLAASATVSSDAGSLALNGGVLGTGNLTLASQSSGNGVLTASGILNNTGTIINSGAGTGTTTISGIIGGSVTGVTQNSSTSLLILSGTNTYAGPTSINNGIINFQNGSAFGGFSPITVASGASAEVQGSITSFGTNALTISGTGAAGATGALENVSGINTAIMPVVLAANTTISSEAGTLNLNGVVSGGFNLTVASVAGSGIVALGNTNTYTGTTIISSGTLQLGTGGTTGSIPTTSAIVDSGSLGFNRSNTVTQGVDFNGAPLTGTGGVTQNGTGTVVLNVQNTYTGATKVNAGILQAGVASASAASGPFGSNSAVVFANVAGATLDLNNFNVQVGSLTGGGTTGGNITLESGNLTVGGDNTSPAAYAGVISGTGAVTKIGTGLLFITGANTFTGGLTIQQGTVLDSVANVGTTSGGAGPSTVPITLGSASGGIAVLQGGGFTITNPINLVAGDTAAGGSIALANSGSPTFAGAIALNGDDLTIQSITGGGNPTVSGSINGTGNLFFTNTAGGSVTVSGAINNVGNITVNGTGTGGTTFSGGVGANEPNITLSGVGGLSITTLPLTIYQGSSNTTTLTNSASNSAYINEIGGITGTGNLVLNNTNFSTLGVGIQLSSQTIAGVATTTNFTGSITNSGTGTTDSNLNGAIGPNVTGITQNSLNSILYIGGQNSTYTGNTNILAGTLEFNGSSGGDNYTVGTQGTIYLGDVSGTASAVLLPASSNNISNPIVVQGGTTNNTLTITTSGLTLNSPTIQLNHDLGLIDNGQGINYQLITVNSPSISGTGNLLLACTNLVNPSKVDLTLTGTGATININGSIIDTSIGSSSITITDTIGTNVVSIVQSSTGPADVLSISGTNSNFSGNTYLNSGTLSVDSAQALGNFGTLYIAGGTLSTAVANNTISNPTNEVWNGSFLFNSFNALATGGNGAPNPITLGASVTVTNIGTATFYPGFGTSGSITGGTAANPDNLTFAVDATSTSQLTAGGFSVAGFVNNTGTLSTTGFGNGAIAFAGGIGSNVTNFTQGSLGVTTLNSVDAYTGSTTVNSGTLALNFTGFSGAQANIVPSTSNLFIGGGTLLDTGKSATTNSQSFASTTFNAGSTTLNLVASGAGSNLLNFGTLTRNTGSTVAFISSIGTVTASNGFTTSTPLTNGIFGGYATVGNEFASFGTGSTSTDIVALGTYTTTLPTDGSSLATANYKLGSTAASGVTVTTTANSNVNSLNLQTNSTTGDTINNGGVLTVSSGAVLASESTSATSVTHNIAGGFLTSTDNTQTAGNDVIFTVNNAATSGTTNLAVSSVIEDTTAGMGLTKSGAGTLTLTGANLYTGATYFNGGILNIAADNSLGAAPTAVTPNALNFAGGTLQLAASFNMSGSRGITLATSGGAIDTNSFNTTYAGVVAGTGSLVKNGAGTLTLTGVNTYAGATTLNAGILNIGSDSNLGVAPPFALAGQLTLNGGTLQLASSFNLNSNRGIYLAAGGGTIDTNGFNTTYGGIISYINANTSTLTKNGLGTLVLTGTTVASAPGSSVGAYIFNAGEMAIFTEPYNGYIFNGGTQLSYTGGSLHPGHNIVLNSGGGAFDLPMAGTTLNQTDQISGVGGLSKFGAGILNLSQPETYTGPTSISGSGFILTSTAASPTNVIYNGVTPNALTFGGGVGVSLVTAAGTTNGQTLANSQTFGSTTLNAGGTTLTITDNATNNSTTNIVSSSTGLLSLGAITRSVGSSLIFTQPSVLTTTTVGTTVTTATTTGTLSTVNGYATSTTNTNGIIGGYATFGSEFATNNGTNVVPFAAYTGSLPATGGSATGNYELIGANQTTTASQTINSLNLQSASITADVLTNTGFTLTLASGGVLASESTAATTVASSITGGFLTSTNAQNDLIITTANAVTSGTTSLTISSVIQDTTAGMSLTKAGGGTLKLTGTNTYTGPTYIDGLLTSGGAYTGILNIASDSNLGTAPATAVANQLTFSGGSLQLSASISLATNRGITLLSSGGTIDTNSSNLTYGGVVTGNGPLNKISNGTLTFNGANTYTGNTTVAAGILNVSSDAGLGAVPVTPIVNQVNLTGGTLQFGASFNLANNRGILITNNSTIDTNGFNSTYAGVITGSNSVNLNLNKNGAGTLTLTGVNTFGGVTVNAGTLAINNMLIGQSASLVANGATLAGVGTIMNPNTIAVAPGGTLTAGSGTTVGMLTVTTGALTLAQTSVFNAVVNNSVANALPQAGVNYSQLVNPGGISINALAMFSVTATTGSTFAPGSVLELITNDPTTNNPFANMTYSSGGYTFTADYTTNPGSFDVDVSGGMAIPEPSTYIAGVLMLGMLGFHERRRLGKLMGFVGAKA